MCLSSQQNVRAVFLELSLFVVGNSVSAAWRSKFQTWLFASIENFRRRTVGEEKKYSYCLNTRNDWKTQIFYSVLGFFSVLLVLEKSWISALFIYRKICIDSVACGSFLFGDSSTIVRCVSVLCSSVNSIANLRKLYIIGRLMRMSFRFLVKFNLTDNEHSLEWTQISFSYRR